MSTNIIQQSQRLASFEVFFGLKAKKGPRAIPMNLDFTSVTSITVNLKSAIDDDILEFVQAVYIDNSNSATPFTIQSRISNAFYSIPPGAQAYLPIVAPNTASFTTSSTGGVVVPIQFLSYPVPTAVWNSGGAGSSSFVLGAVTINGSQGVDGSGTITTGGTAQSLFGGSVPTHGFAIYNPDASGDVWVSDSTTAAVNAAGSVRCVANGGGYETPPNYKPIGAVSIVGAATGTKFTARRW